MAFTTFAFFPAAPPGLRAGKATRPTSRLIGPISGHIPFVSFSFEELFQRGWEYSNPVAAVPAARGVHPAGHAVSLAGGRALGPAAPGLYPLAMAFALVYTAEHYLFDVLLGWAYTLVAVWVVSRVAEYLSERRATVSDP